MLEPFLASRISSTAAGKSMLAMIANLWTLGTAWRRNSIFLLARSADWTDNPVTFPPGRARLATNPVPSGSADNANTIGMVVVTCLALSAPAEIRKNDVDLKPDELGRDVGIAFGMALSPAIFDSDCFALDPTEFMKPLDECVSPWVPD